MHDIINDLFSARDNAHRLHLTAKSFSTHLALGELYSQLLEKTDEFAEVYQGQYGLMNLAGHAEDKFNLTDPLQFITALVGWALDVKKYFKQEDTHILNIWDEIVSIILRAKYKLENLK